MNVVKEVIRFKKGKGNVLQKAMVATSSQMEAASRE
jgi:hypothetical protein